MGQALDNEIVVLVGADFADLKPGMEASAQEVERAAERMQRSVSGMNANVDGAMTQMSSTVKAANDDAARSFNDTVEASSRAGKMIGAAFVAVSGAIVVAGKAAIDSMDRMNEEAERVGVTTTALSQLAHAGKMTGLEFGDMTSAITRLSAKMQDAQSGDKNAVAWFKDLGVSVTDASGKMKSVDKMLEEVADRFAQFEDGAAKTALAVDGFGRSGARLVPLLNQGSAGIREMRQEADELGATIGDKASAEAAKFNDQLDRLSTLTAGAARSMVADLLPALNSVIERFITGARYVGGFAGGISMLLDGGKAPGEQIRSLTDELNDLLDARDRYLKSNADTSAIDTSITTIQRKIKAYKELQVAQALAESGDNYGNEGRGLTQGGGGKTEITRTKTDTGGGRAPAAESRMAGWEAALAEQKAAFMEANNLYEMSLADERKYWQDLIKNVDAGAKEYGAVKKKIAELDLRILKEKAQDGRGLAMEEIEELRRSATAEVEIRRAAAEQSFAQGNLSKLEMIQLERQFEDERYNISREAVERRLELMRNDPNMNPVEYQRIKNQLIDIERKHNAEQMQIATRAISQSRAPALAVFQSAERSFAQATTAMLTRAMTWRQALGSIFQSVGSAFIEQIVVKPAVEWAAGLLRQTALYQAFFGVKKTMEVADTAATIAAQKTIGITSVMSNASIAATAAMASVAAIPLVGWAMAPGVGASTYGLAMGFLPSAEGGWDIPAGATGLMRYHEREMMLPAKHADTIRELGENGGVGGRGLSLYVNSASPKDMVRALKDGGALHKALRDMERRYVSKKS